MLITLISVTFAEKTKWGLDSADGVSVLSDSGFDEFIAAHKFVLVKFFTPGCTHCKAMAKDYGKIARTIDETEKLPVVVAEMNVEINRRTAERFEVTAYPTIFLFYKGIPIQYQGDRSIKNMSVFLGKHTTERAEELTEMDQVHELLKQRLGVLLILNRKSSKMIDSLNALSLEHPKIPIRYTFLDEAMTHLDLDPQPSLMIVRSFDEGSKILSKDEEITYKDMRQFFEQNKNSLVIPFDEESSGEVFRERKTVMVFFTETGKEAGLSAFQEFAKTRPEGITFMTSGVKSGVSAKLAEFIGVNESNLGEVRLIKIMKESLNKYKLKDVTKESLEEFTQKFLQGSLKKYLKSDPVPEDSSAAVKVIVGDNFEKMVFENDKYVFLESYAPWCSHCKELEPIWTKLAERLEAFDNLMIAKMDATSNEHPAHMVHGFPDLRLFKKGSKATPIKYKGERTLKALTEFLKAEMGADWPLEMDESL